MIRDLIRSGLRLPSACLARVQSPQLGEDERIWLIDIGLERMFPDGSEQVWAAEGR